MLSCKGSLMLAQTCQQSEVQIVCSAVGENGEPEHAAEMLEELLARFKAMAQGQVQSRQGMVPASELIAPSACCMLSTWSSAPTMNAANSSSSKIPGRSGAQAARPDCSIFSAHS